MDNINILILVSAIVFLLVLWMIVGVRHLKHLKSAIDEQWEVIDERLRKRQSLIPNLVETFRMYLKDQETLMEKITDDRLKAAKEYSRGLEKIALEHELSIVLNEVAALGKANVNLGKDTNFLEITKEIDDIEKDMENEVKQYNEMVRFYNLHRNLQLLRPVAAIFKFGAMNIFEVES